MPDPEYDPLAGCHPNIANLARVLMAPGFQFGKLALNPGVELGEHEDVDRLAESWAVQR